MKGKISTRFRNINIALFALAFCVMAAVMAAVFYTITERLSSDYAERYAVSTADALGAHINRELSLLAAAAKSETVINWMSEEATPQSEETRLKETNVYKELSGIVGQLYNSNLYVGLTGSLRQYRVDIDEMKEENLLLVYEFMDEDDPEHQWFFKSVEADGEYTLDVDMDSILHRKRVWLNYKVQKDGAVLGVLSTGLEFSHIADEIFAKYEENDMRGLIVDRDGAVYMDSALMHDEKFLYEDYIIENEISESEYRYRITAPIKNTDWSVVILSETPSLFGFWMFVPILAAALILLIVFAAVTNAANYRLIFSPLVKLSGSLVTLKDDYNVNVLNIYGLDREDELGELSRTIRDLFTKANVDALTGVYNRHFMEANLKHIMDILTRSKGVLSLIMLDIDYFKKYNDTYGHAEGDECLKEVAAAVSAGVTRASDFVARYGGEEFVVVLPNTDERGAKLIAEKLLESVRGRKLPHEKNEAAPYVTISVGVTTGVAAHPLSREDFVKRADEALYMSKENGRNRSTFLPLEPV